jgi:hypothetical protein
VQQKRTCPLARNTDRDPNHGVGKTQQWLMPGIYGAHCRDDHDNGGCYSSRDYVVKPA